MIRILHCVSKMDRGGIETLLMNLYRNINRDKIQFDFLVTTDEIGDFDKEIGLLGGKIYRVTSRRTNIIRNRKDLNTFFRNHRYEIVHMHISSLSYIEPLIIATKHNVPIRIVHSHSTYLPNHVLHKTLHYINKKRISNFSTTMLACSKDAADWAFKCKNNKHKYITIFKNAIDTKEFSFDKNIRKKIRKEMDLNNQLVVGHVGRFVKSKNHSFIIDMFKHLKRNEKNSKLILVGEGELKQNIIYKVKQMNLEDSVLFLGSRSDVGDLIQAMDILVLPSTYEGLGMVLIEAQTSGLPVIASESIPTEANITHLFNSLDVASGPTEWAQKIISITKDKEERVSMKNEVDDSGYEIRSSAEKLEEFYMSKLEEFN